MSAAERSVVVADFVAPPDAPAGGPTGTALVAAAREAGADRVAVTVRATADGWAVVHAAPKLTRGTGEVAVTELTLAELRNAVGGARRVATLEETLLAAHRARLGLVLRIHDTLVVDTLAGALGVTGGTGPAALRARFLVVVPDMRVGRRLRADARDLPSARSVAATGGAWRGALTRRFPNLARAAADADDLVVPAALVTPERVRDTLVPHLRRRGAFVWVEGVAPERRSDYEGLGAGGLFVTLPFTGRLTAG